MGRECVEFRERLGREWGESEERVERSGERDWGLSE